MQLSLKVMNATPRCTAQPDPSLLPLLTDKYRPFLTLDSTHIGLLPGIISFCGTYLQKDRFKECDHRQHRGIFVISAVGVSRILAPGDPVRVDASAVAPSR
jgi:hypothetical protein